MGSSTITNKALTGLALRKRLSRTGGLIYEVLYASGWGHADHVLIARTDDRDIVALWRGLARDLGMPLLLDHPNGVREPLTPMLGDVVLGTAATDRRALKGRGRMKRDFIG